MEEIDYFPDEQFSVRNLS